MASARKHAYMLAFPENMAPAGGLLDRLVNQPHRDHADLLMDFRELIPSEPVELNECDGKPCEKVKGVYVPRRICFMGVQINKGDGLSEALNDLSIDHPSRFLTSALSWRTPDGKCYYLFSNRVKEHPFLFFSAERCIAEERLQPSQNVSLVRDWSPPPSSPARLVPFLKGMHQRYGGDPITIQLNDRIFHRRLFIGGVDIQGEQRPQVDVVLNLGEDASRWAATTPQNESDRWDNKGEGSEGMSVSEIMNEVSWVIERLRNGKRVLVHCSAGMNRSATICCAVLIMLEKLSAEAALARIREKHPWARPDPHHWLSLRWIAHTLLGF